MEKSTVAPKKRPVFLRLPISLAMVLTLAVPHCRILPGEGPAEAAGIREVPCSSIESTDLEDARGLVLVGRCPATVDLSGWEIGGNLRFHDLQGLSTLNLSDAIIHGSLTLIGLRLDTLVLRGTQVGGEVYIAENSGSYEWIDNQTDDETCECRPEYGQTQFREINADLLSARAFTMHGVWVGKLSMESAQITGLVRLSRGQFKEQPSFHYLRALGLDLNSAKFPEGILAGHIQLEGNFSLECSEVGKKLIVWGSRFGGQLHLEGTRFKDTEVYGFLSEMQELNLASSEGNIALLHLERSKIPILRFTDIPRCVRGPTLQKVLTKGMQFEWLNGDLDEKLSREFFAAGQLHDPTLYRRLANNYTAHGQHDAADEALIYQNPWLGRIRWLGSSLLGFTSVLALWLTPIVAWSLRKWPPRAGLIDRAILAADLLLPDLVALGARERYQAEINKLTGLRAFLVAAYRLLGWVIISVILYVIIERASY